MEEQAKSVPANAMSDKDEAAKVEHSTPTKPPLKDKLQVVQNMLAIVGMVGTLFVWCAANFYVGDVEVVPSRAYQNISVQVFNRKGEETTYHAAKFQLMPGMYHIEVTADGSAKYPADIEVQFLHTKQVLVSLMEPAVNQRSNQTPAATAPPQAPEEQALTVPPAAPEAAAPAPPQKTQPGSITRPQQQAEAQPQQVSDMLQAESDQQSERDEHHHWWQFRHKKTD